MTKAKTDSVGRRVRREWSVARKRRIVEEIALPGATVSGVARRHGLSPNQLFYWRKAMGARDAEVRMTPAETGAGFSPVVVTRAATAVPDAVPNAGFGRLEIVLAGGAQLIVSGSVPSATVVDVIRALLSA